MEVGSFIELQFPKGLEFYKENKNIARLNSGRAAIWHAFRITGCKAIWLPYYQCDTVRSFLIRKGVQIRYYHIDKEFSPKDLKPSDDEAVLIVNYYGVMSNVRMQSLAAQYKNVIIDNSQAFFSAPIEKCLNVYSCRKFVGVPDGAYVVGNGAEQYVNEYEQCFSSDTAVFLLQRIEYGCEGKAYESRQMNEHRIDFEDCMRMSKLTRAILDGTDYKKNKTKRKENFQVANELFHDINSINATQYYDDDTVPMVYPFVLEKDGLMEQLQAAKHFQGHWWSYLCDEMEDTCFEKWLSRYIIPITIDQRYDRDYLKTIYQGYRKIINCIVE